VQARARAAADLSADEAAWARAVGGSRARDVWEGMVSEEIKRNQARPRRCAARAARRAGPARPGPVSSARLVRQELAGPGVKLGTTDHATWVALPCGHDDGDGSDQGGGGL
jgi:hypothetical protein